MDTGTYFLTELDRVTKVFASVQEQCGKVLVAGAPSGTDGCYVARQRVFERLQRLMEEWHGNPKLQENREVKEVLQRELQKLAEGEKILEQRVGEAREQVQESLADLRRGKKSLSGYHVGHGRTIPPRFLSNRM